MRGLRPPIFRSRVVHSIRTHGPNIIRAGTVALLVTVATGGGPESVLAQTPLPPTPGAAPPPVHTVPRPVADSVVKQAEQHSEGAFGAMTRASVGGQIQDAWDDAEGEAGVFAFGLCEACTYKVRLREHMVTVLELPEGEIMDRADVGDSGSFIVTPRGPRRLVIKPRGYGVDSNLMVYGRSGNVYPIYLRAESFNSDNVPDLFVRIVGQVVVPDPGMDGIASIEGEAAFAADLGPLSVESLAMGPLTVGEVETVTLDALDGLETPSPHRRSGDFVQEAAFDADALRGWGDYKLWAGGPDGHMLKPETVFRDDYFTYIRFGDRWTDIELPTAYVVVDDIDEVVNTRIQGRTYIVESVRPLITLKSGLSYLCIQYEGVS